MATNPTSVKAAVGLAKASQKAYTQKWSFLVVFITVLFISTSVAAALDILPETKVADDAPMTLSASPIVAISAPEAPTKIEIPSIDLAVTVSNPTSTEVSVLDAALHTGAVRYPTSSNLGEPGNVIIFGHSSYLPVVNNKSYKAFNDIQDLEKGERITVTGEGHRYVYAVDTVRKANAEEDSIPLTNVGNTLTLATCNSFGTKSDRFIVTATLVETYSL